MFAKWLLVQQELGQSLNALSTAMYGKCPNACQNERWPYMYMKSCACNMHITSSYMHIRLKNYVP